MSATAQKEVPLQAAQALAAHLRDYPEEASLPPGTLAQRFGLAEDFVAEFLESLTASRESPRPLRTTLDPLKRAFQTCRLFFRRLTALPVHFVGVTAFLSIVGYILIETFVVNSEREGPLRGPDGVNVMLQGDEGLFLTFALVTLAVHLACYFRHGMVRYPLFGGLVCWMISAPIIMVLIWTKLPQQATSRAHLTLLAVAVGMLILNAIYACLGMVAAVAGGAWRVRQKGRERDRLSRQELLERLFDIRERLRASEGAQSGIQEKGWERWDDRFDRLPWAWTAFLGLVISGLEMFLTGVVFSDVMGLSPRSPLAALAHLATAVLWLMALVAIGFFSRRTMNAILNSWLFVLAGLAPLALPVGPYGPDYVREAIAPIPLAIQLGVAFVVAAIASAGGRIEAHAVQERRLVQNDPAALLAELVRLEWQLSPKTADVCVLSVDAARSSEMKAAADPWAVEYSFREYLSFLERLVHAEGGSVLSTAGDGAVAEFPSAAQAYQAAKRIQTELETFNQKRNRLDRPFRVRIGMHMGPVAGSINDVEFSAVIDIAAHVQASAPVGGIAVTAAVAEQLAGEPFAQLAEPVDGQTVLLSLRPTSDA
jgi:class 3 adenylate cyclase